MIIRYNVYISIRHTHRIIMFRTQVYITENERKMLLLFSNETGKAQSSIIREAIDQYIEKKILEKRARKHNLRAAAGLWAEREDLPDLNQLRKEMYRVLITLNAKHYPMLKEVHIPYQKQTNHHKKTAH
jgi:Ribbon-helix-helix domain